jgi:tryptophan 2,3-dioxygenase
MAQAPTDYELYLRVPELLSLQKSAEQRACPDELMFQIVHQTAELWMKLLEHEMEQFVQALDGPELQLHVAQTALHRVHHIQRLLLSGLEMLYMLSPTDYMRIRVALGRGSGQESPGFRRMLALGGEIWPHFSRLLERSGVLLVNVYRDPRHHPAMYAIAEGLIEFDLRLQEWRNRHILLVYRTIGIGTPSLKGKHSELLEKGLRTQFFPALWEVRDEIFGEWTAAHPHGAEYSLAKPTTPDEH